MISDRINQPTNLYSIFFHVFSTLGISIKLMKTYFKHPYERPLPAIYYLSSDILRHFSLHANVLQRMVQPSRKEQQHLMLSYNTPRLLHVHLGKYGIKPLGSFDDLLCERRHPNSRKWKKVIISHFHLIRYHSAFSKTLNIDIIRFRLCILG